MYKNCSKIMICDLFFGTSLYSWFCDTKGGENVEDSLSFGTDAPPGEYLSMFGIHFG